jgi:hypothetical protein
VFSLLAFFADENEAKGVQPRVAIQAAPQKWLFEAGGRRRFKFSSVNLILGVVDCIVYFGACGIAGEWRWRFFF